VAVMVCEPAASDRMVSTAMPALFKAPLPIGIPLSEKVTVPVGVPLLLPEAVTMPVSVMPCPKTLGFGALLRAVMLGPLFTV
jgi:hypothetical protein